MRAREDGATLVLALSIVPRGNLSILRGDHGRPAYDPRPQPPETVASVSRIFGRRHAELTFDDVRSVDGTS
jgi:hypothetical protein